MSQIVKDRNNIIKSFPSQYKSIIALIEEIGSFETYEYYEDKKSEKAKIMKENGFNPTLLQKIQRKLKCTEQGDCDENRFHYLIHEYCKNIILKGDKESVLEDYRDYRCWNRFYIDQRHTYYEYEKWMGSLIDLILSNETQNNLELVLEITDEHNFVKISNLLLPSLHYNLDNMKAKITSKDLYTLFNHKNFYVGKEYIRG